MQTEVVALKNKIFKGEIRAEFRGKDPGEMFKVCMIELAKIAGVFALLFCIWWMTFKPDWGYFGGGFVVEDPFSGFEYYVDDEYVIVRTLVNTWHVKDGYLKIPDSFWGRPVTTINFRQWHSDWGVETIEIPDSVTVIYDAPVGVKEVVGGANVTKIASEAFRDCNMLTKIELGDKVEEIGNYAFENCTNLKEVRLGNSLERVEAGTFYGCTALEKVELGYGVQDIGTYAFYGCSSLTEVTHTGNLDEIGEDAFEGTPWAQTEEGKALIVAYSIEGE